MSDWNEAKLETLEDAYASGEVTSSELAYSCGLTLHAASTRLKRYHRQGLFTRTKIERQYVYYITVKGIERIDWLRKQKVTMELYQTISTKRCPINREKIPAPKRNRNQNSNTELSQETRFLEDISAKRCPVVKPRTPETPNTIDLDEDDFYEDEYDNTDEYDNIQEDILDETVLFLKNIQRCKVNRKENDSIDAEDIEEDENIEDILKRLSQQRCKVNNEESD